MRAVLMSAGFAMLLAVTACGTSPGDRTLSGGMIGAAGGAALAGATGGNAGTGAAIGALGGALVGALTDPCDLDLGDPFWRDHGGRRGYERRCGHPYRDHR